LSSAPARTPRSESAPGEPADDLDDDMRDEPSHAASAAVAGSWAASSIADLDDDEPDWASQEQELPPAEPRPVAPVPRAPVREDSRPPAPNPRDQVSRRQAQDPNELFGPAWERPHRYEAYPSLRTRVGLPGMSGVGRVGIAALALFVAALALFFVGPMLLGIGDDNPGGGGAATATPRAEITPTPAPTPVPEPTPTIYVVKKGDTMSKIANKFDVTVDQLLAANPQIKNPNKISIGDEVTIPVPEADAEPS
jgi:nucleoid-associated protein YgaU